MTRLCPGLCSEDPMFPLDMAGPETAAPRKAWPARLGTVVPPLSLLHTWVFTRVLKTLRERRCGGSAAAEVSTEPQQPLAACLHPDPFAATRAAFCCFPCSLSLHSHVWKGFFNTGR